MSRTKEQCGCPLCVSHRALDAIKVAVADIEAADEYLMNIGTEDEMAYCHLQDEANEVLDMPWWRPFAARKRLREALITTRRDPDRPWVDWRRPSPTEGGGE